jgi:hypothetical protein
MRSCLICLFAAVLLCAGCSDDTASPGREAGSGPDTSVTQTDTGGTTADVNPLPNEKGIIPPKPDSVTKPKEAAVPPTQPGTVCTQTNKTCPAGQKCAFLEAWNAPKGTCLTVATGGCSSWDDPRCKVAGLNYSVMCGPYTENAVTTHLCFLLCKWNNVSYACPPLHTCKTINGMETCVPQ